MLTITRNMGITTQKCWECHWLNIQDLWTAVCPYSGLPHLLMLIREAVFEWWLKAAGQEQALVAAGEVQVPPGSSLPPVLLQLCAPGPWLREELHTGGLAAGEQRPSASGSVSLGKLLIFASFPSQVLKAMLHTISQVQSGQPPAPQIFTGTGRGALCSCTPSPGSVLGVWAGGQRSLRWPYSMHRALHTRV